MSEFKVPLTTIKEILPHNNATSLEFAKCYDFNVIVTKGKYKVGDVVIYVPIDSILPQNLTDQLFPPDSKIKLNKNRIKQIKIRGQYSQGLIIDPNEESPNIPKLHYQNDLETNLAEKLGITKYEPPEMFQGSNTSVKKRDKPKENPYFHKYNGVDNIKWYPDLFTNEEVVIQEKLHGSNCRAAILPFQANTLWKKVLRFFKLAPKYEYCYGSNNVQLQERRNYKGFYGTNVYGAVLEKVKVFDKIKPGETVYGELIGEGIQKNYHYGHKEHHFVLYDIKVMQEDGSQIWLNPEDAKSYAIERGFDFVPVLYKGVFDKELAKSFTIGDSAYNPVQKVREGIVIKSRFGYNDKNMSSDKKCLKLLSEKYLEADNSDFH